MPSILLELKKYLLSKSKQFSNTYCFVRCISYVMTHLILSIAPTRQVLLLYINVTDMETEAQKDKAQGHMKSKWWYLAEKPMLLTAMLYHFQILINRDISSEGMKGRRRNQHHWPHSQLGKDWVLWARLEKKRQVLDIPKRLLWTVFGYWGWQKLSNEKDICKKALIKTRMICDMSGQFLFC